MLVSGDSLQGLLMLSSRPPFSPLGGSV